MSSTRGLLSLVTGGVLFAIGAFIAARPMWTHNGVLTGTRWLDLAFAMVFMLRGLINVRAGLTRLRDAGSSA